MISIIVPVYNAEHYLDKCIESLVNQTYKNLEIILIDDGSKDNSGSICDEWCNKASSIKVIHQTNAGVSAARNAGLDACTGDYVMFVDSDDYIRCDYCEWLMEKAIGENAEMIVTNFEEVCIGCISSPDAFRFIQEERLICGIEDALLDCCNRMTYTHVIWAKLYKRETIGDIRFDTELKFAEDTQFVRRAMWRAKRIGLYCDCGYYYVRNENSVTISDKSFRRAFDSMRVAFDLLEKCRETQFSQVNLAYELLFNYIYGTYTSVCKSNFSEREEKSYVREIDKYYVEIVKESFSTSMKRKIAVSLFYQHFYVAKKLYRCINFCGSILRYR